jgi:UDP-2,3-diacylglucosamine pyrophosphatase LpxH
MAKAGKSVIQGAVLGAALGAGAVLYRDHQNRKHPDQVPEQQRINAGLGRALTAAREKHKRRLEDNTRLVIFSDIHKGAGDTADDFLPCKATYLASLDYYLEQDFTLVLLGDIEELWENSIPEVMDTHRDVFLSEGRFYPDRYLRILGNHDDAWNDPAAVAQYLEPLYPNLELLHGLVLEYDEPPLYGELFLAHGHQGTLDSDILAGFSPRLLPIYRQLQNRFHIGRTTPAYDDYLRGRHDTLMYRWAAAQKKLILIAGHTHRPVWSSLSHLDQLTMQLYALRLRQQEMEASKYQEAFQNLLHAIIKRRTKDRTIGDTLKTTPAYFNTGCCRFEDGDITGIEITGKSIGLVKWDRRTLGRVETISMPLAELFALL